MRREDRRRIARIAVPASITFFIIALTALAPVSTAQASTYSVTTTVDADCSDNTCDLPSALADARSNGEDDTLNLDAGNFSSTVNTPFSYNFNSSETFSLTIRGAGPGLTYLDGGSQVRPLFIQSPGDVTVRDMTIMNGSDNLGGGGGGLVVGANGSAMVLSVEFLDSATNGDGGGAYISAAGGTIRNCDFSNNFSDQEGGGLFLLARADFVVESNLFQNNLSKLSGGGAYISYLQDSSLTIILNDFLNNDVFSTGFNGGGLWLSIRQGEVRENSFEGNSVASSAAFGDARGGGVYVQPSDPGPVTFDGNIFTGNFTGGAGRGGGLYVNDIFSIGATFTAVNNVFLENESQDGGAAMYYETAENTLNFTNNTAVINTGTVAVSIRTGQEAATVNVYNNIIWGNTPADLSIFDGSPLHTSPVNLFNNDLDIFSVVPSIGTLYKEGGANISGDPLLLNPAGGDVHLSAGSPAIDTGLDTAPGLGLVSGDYEGEARIQGPAVDMGADETGGSVVPTEPTIAVTDSEGLPDDYQISFFANIDDTVTETVTVVSRGQSPLVIGTVNSTNSRFWVPAAMDNCSGTTLNLNESCTFDVKFSPFISDSGTVTGTLSIPSNASNNNNIILDLSGEGTTPPPPINDEGSGCIGCSLSDPSGGSSYLSLVLLGLFILGLAFWRRRRFS
jgi:MYXO-CTERM domain-containing protein